MPPEVTSKWYLNGASSREFDLRIKMRQNYTQDGPKYDMLK